MPDAVELNDTDVAVSFMIDAKMLGLLVSVPSFWDGVLASLARSVGDYACAANLMRADRRRQGAALRVEESERRHPSGRRVHTRAEAAEMRDEAASRVAAAEDAERAAISAVGVETLGEAAAILAYVRDRELVGDDWHRVNDLAQSAVQRADAIMRNFTRGFFVRSRATRARQPRGGLVALALFDLHELSGDPLSRSKETGSAGTIASAVELLVRWHLSGDERSILPPVEAALEGIRGVRRGEQTSGPGRIAALVRSGDDDMTDELDWEEDDDETLEHVALMAERAGAAFELFGAPLTPGTVETSSSRYQLRGQVDFLGADVLWDLKVSERKPTATDVLQLMLYWLVVRDDPALTHEPTHVELINPRLGAVWRLRVDSLSADTLSTIEAIALDHPGELRAWAVERTKSDVSHAVAATAAQYEVPRVDEQRVVWILRDVSREDLATDRGDRQS